MRTNLCIQIVFRSVKYVHMARVSAIQVPQCGSTELSDGCGTQNVNPGLARRFAIENAFTFEDFTEPQLREILDFKLKDQDLGATDMAKQVAGDLLNRAKNRPNFGNAGEVENMLGPAKSRYHKRQASVPPDQRSNVIFEAEDFDPDWERGRNAAGNLTRLFEDLVGCDDIVKKLGDYQKIALAMKASGIDMRKQIPMSFAFKGPPGM